MSKVQKTQVFGIKNPRKTQVIVENLVLADLLDRKAVGDLKRKIGHYGQIVVSSVQLFLVPVRKEDKPIKSLLIEQPSPQHLTEKKVIITTNFSKVLDDFLK